MIEEAILGVQALLSAAVLWLLKIAYERNGCIKRIEQKLDSFIEHHHDKN